MYSYSVTIQWLHLYLNVSIFVQNHRSMWGDNEDPDPYFSWKREKEKKLYIYIYFQYRKIIIINNNKTKNIFSNGNKGVCILQNNNI